MSEEKNIAVAVGKERQEFEQANVNAIIEKFGNAETFITGQSLLSD